MSMEDLPSFDSPIEIEEAILECLKNMYKLDKNPLYVWEAWSCARLSGLEVPKWVLKYFDTCAKNLLRLHTNPPKRTTDIIKVFGFDGSRTAYKNIAINNKNDAIAITMGLLINGGTKKYIAAEEVGKHFKMSKTAVLDIYKNMKTSSSLISKQ